MSTTETGISGSSTSFKARHSRARTESVTDGPAALERRNVFVVHRAARFPALQHLVPADLALLEGPAFRNSVEASGKGYVEDPGVSVVVGGHPQTDLVAKWDHFGHPRLAQLVVAATFEPVVKLLVVTFF